MLSATSSAHENRVRRECRKSMPTLRELERLSIHAKMHKVQFTLNGKGKFYRGMINPMKMPTLDQILEECSANLGIAIHRLYTPQGKLITNVAEILAYDGWKIIACPRNERPYLNEASSDKLPPVLPRRYAPREAYSVFASESNKSASKKSESAASGNSSGNSIEKRQRLPSINNSRYIPRRRLENGITNATYVPKTNSTTSVKRVAPMAKKPQYHKLESRETNKKLSKDTATSSAESNKTKDSGKGNSLNSSQQSERPLSMTDRKAQMIRDELRANLNQQNSGSDQYSEEDIIKEEESDYDNIGGGGINSGTSDEEEGDDSALGSTEKPSPKSRSTSAANSIPPTSGSSKLESAAEQKSKSETTIRQDTPYNPTPSRQTTAASRQTTAASRQSTAASRQSSTGSLEPESRHSTRPTTSSTAVHEVSDDVEVIEEEGEGGAAEDIDDDNESLRETPAIHTPDTRLPSAKSRVLSAGSARSFASDSSRAWSRISGYSDKEQILPSDEEEEEEGEAAYRDMGTAERRRLGEAATKIQAAFKGFRIRKKNVKLDKERQKPKNQSVTYTIEVMLGTRFGLDFNTPLYFVLHGENGASEKVYTSQEDWLFLETRCYEPESWIVTSAKLKKLGVLTSIDVGHEQEGYGAGTFIERITVTEDLLEGRRFLFIVEKWFDSGQVDGLIERNVKVASFLYMMPIREGERSRESKGRWEFRLHTMNSDLGGTTSKLNVVGFGELGSHICLVENDSLLRDPYSVALIQIDFGTAIGRLRKVRFEISPAGDKPNYYLEYVEAQDMDTRERCVLMVNNWLLMEPTAGYRKYQPFREVAIFTTDWWPDSVKIFEGTVTFADRSLLTESSSFPLQFVQNASRMEKEDDISEYSSGCFPVVATKLKNGSISHSYKVEFVTMEPAPKIRVVPDVTELGKDILDGFHILKEMYDNLIDRNYLIEGDICVGEQLFIEEIVQKSGDHYPYVYSYRKSTIEYEQNFKKGPYMKLMLASEHSGASSISTARKWKKSDVKVVEETAHWQLTMSLAYRLGEPIIPTVVLVAKDRRTFEMECQMEKPEQYEAGMLLRYTVTSPNFGNPFKVRVSCDTYGPDNHTHVHKIMLTELKSKTHVFLKVASDLNEFETCELECVYPDLGEARSREYELHIRTLEGGGDFRPYINIIGDNGDTGYRAYPGITKFAPKMVVDMDLSAINLRELRSVEMWAKTGEPQNWKGTIKIITSDDLVYQSGVLELSKNGQIALASLQFVEQIEPVVSGERSL